MGYDLEAGLGLVFTVRREKLDLWLWLDLGYGLELRVCIIISPCKRMLIIIPWKR